MLCPLLIAGMASAVTYSVAGSSAALFGASWDQTNTSTDMTSTDGVNYTFTKEGVTLSKGTIEYKVVVDHSWNTSYGKDGTSTNASYTLSEDGVYDVVVSFNAETHVPSMEATKKGSATVDHTWSVIGGIFGTNWNQDWAMTETSSGVFTCTVEDQEISAGTYEYKVRADNAWDLSYGDPNGNNGNASFTIDKDGKYNVTFTFTLATGAVEATPTLIEETVIDAIYTAVGTPAAIFGAAWDPSLVANEMVKGTDGVTYTFTKEGVVLEAEDIQFKVIKGHSWGGEEYGDNGNNVVYNVTEAGTYDVTITFNSETGATPVITVTKQGGDEPIDKTIESVFLKGDFDNWGDGLYLEHSAAAANQFVGTLDLTNVTGDVKIKLLAYDNDNMEYWKGYAGITTLISDGSWLSDANDNDNILLSNSTTGYKTYAVTATWEGIDPETGWTLTIAGLDQRESTPVDGQELVNGDHKVVIKGIHYTNLAENNYVLTITSEETMDGLGGSFWHVNGEGTEQLSTKSALREDNKQIVVTTTSTSDPQLYTPLYVLMPGEINFGQPTIEWEEQQAEVTYQVTFVNEAGWEGDIYAYAWTGDGESEVKLLGDWPGTQMENEGNNTFSITLPSAAEYIIFNNNGSQTANLAFENNKQYTNAEPTTVTYTVAGNNADIFGTAWDATNTDNDMTESDGIYTFTKTDIELAAGDEIKFKVVKNHSWDTSYGDAEGNDVAYTVKLTGSHDITITFDPSVGVPEITVTNDEEPVDGQELVNGDHKVVIKGVHYLNLTENNYVLTIKSEETMTGLGGSFWSTSAGNKDIRENMTVAEDGKTITLTATSTTDPQLYTPLYVMMPGEVNFGQPTIDWEEVGEVTPVGEYKVKFVNMAGWETVKAHAWNNDGSITEWPGIEGTAVDNTTAFGNSYPTFEFTFTSEPTNVQFNPGNNTKELNFTYVEGALYSYDGLADNSIFLFTDDANQFKPAQAYTVTEASASYARQFTPGNVCTVVLPFAIGADVAAAAGKFYRITSIADGYIRGTEEIPAPYVPYIFIPATEYPFTNIGIGQLPAVQNNSITTAEGYTLQFVTETTELASDASYDYYGFQGGKFVKAAYAVVNPFRSYIKVAKSANAPATLIWTDDEATGISSLKADIQNGKADVYDLQGRRVLNPVRGLYIVNGKKVIVK